ncbi:MAG: tetratricopeptide repeat protein [Spirochaetales bacterium]|nr:tetratricopeptide repeat protein [Spirochaetales bacterium]
MPKASHSRTKENELLFRKALEAGSRRDYEQAIELLERVVAETEALPEARLYLGRALQAAGRLGAAVEHLDRYARGRPEDAEAWFFLGRALIPAGRLNGAARCLRRSLRLGLSGAEGWALYGYTLLRLHRSAAAVRGLEKAVALAPDDKRIFNAYLSALYVRAVRLLSRGQAELASQMLGFVIGNGLDGPPQRLYRSRALRELGRTEEALDECEAALAAAPDDPGIALRYVELLFAAGRPREALESLERIRAKHPDLPDLEWDEASISSYRALMLLESGDPSGALAAALARIKADPSDSRVRAVAAEAYRALGRLDRAVAHYARALELEPAAGELRLAYAAALFDSGDFASARKAADRAARDGGDQSIAAYYSTLCSSRSGDAPSSLIPRLHSLLADWPADPDLMFALGEALYRDGRADLASGWFDKVSELRPDDELCLLYRISSAESVGDEKAADRAYARYLERWPDNAKIRRDHVERLAAREDWNETARWLEGGLAWGNPGASGRRLLARAYRETGRYREAASLYRDLLREEHKDPELLMALAWCLDKAGSTEIAVALLRKGAPVVRKAGPYLALGKLLLRGNRSEDAAEALREAAALAPRDPLPLRLLATLYAKSGVREFAEQYSRAADDLEAAARGSARKKPKGA